jgi:hypothetical protein
MAAPGIPVDLRVVMALPALGIPAEAINFRSVAGTLSTVVIPPTRANRTTLRLFRNVSMDSDKALCVRTEIGDSKSVQIVSLATGTVTNKFPMAAESAVLSPDGKSIAVRGEGGALPQAAFTCP